MSQQTAEVVTRECGVCGEPIHLDDNGGWWHVDPDTEDPHQAHPAN